jgi:F-type H+-transporting ATPase subunit b
MIELVLLVALVVLVAALWKPARKALIGGLDARAESIRRDLDEAQRLHEEAKALLARYERQLHEGEKLAAEIAEQAEAERGRLEARMRAELEVAIKARTQQATDRIAQEEARAIQEVRARAADLTVRTTRRLLGERLGPAEAQRLLGGAIEEVGKKLA